MCSSDLHTEFPWSVALLVLILAMSWGVSRRVRSPRFLQSAVKWRLVRDFGEGEARRIAFPLIALLMLSCVREILHFSGWQVMSAFDLASPFLLAWLLANASVYVLHCIFPQGSLLRDFERFIIIAVWGVMALDMTGLGTPVIDVLEKFHVTVGKQRLDLWMALRGLRDRKSVV